MHLNADSEPVTNGYKPQARPDAGGNVESVLQGKERTHISMSEDALCMATQPPGLYMCDGGHENTTSPLLVCLAAQGL